MLMRPNETSRCAITGREQMQQTNVRQCGLFDHLVGAHEQCGWYSEAEDLRGLEVENQVSFR
jgi:hypothetical protein